MKIKGNKILGGAVSLGVGAFIAKVLGALYRVPLTNLLGSRGLGLYQMVFPVYSVLLDFSGGGIPSALSKLISSSDEDKKLQNAHDYLFASLKMLAIFGAFGSVFMLVFALPLSVLQGDGHAYLGYLFLSPAIIMVSLLSCFRGYFQGLMKMSPTATSQVVEQVVKLGLGLVFVRLFLPDIKWAVAGATFAITISEVVALCYLLVVYKRHKYRYGLHFAFDRSKFSTLAKKTVKVAIPITLVCVIIPLSQVVDSFLMINIIGNYRNDATSLYGLLSGVVATVINLPVSVCHGLATVSIPAVSKEKSECAKRIAGKKALALTVLASLPCALIIFAFAPFIINLLFKSLDKTEMITAINLLRLTAPCIVLQSVLQTCNAVLIGHGRLYSPVISLSVGVGVKIIVNAILLSSPKLNIYGGGIALIACYFTVCLINLIMIFRTRVKHEGKIACRRQYAS